VKISNGNQHSLEYTLNFAEKNNLNVIPIKYADKIPATKWKEYQRRKITLREIKEFWSGDKEYNIGILGGGVSDNLVVIDFDDQELYKRFFGRWAEDNTSVVKTPRGYHVYFKTPNPIKKYAINLFNKYGTRKSSVSIQGDGGYVLAPPSVHPSGGRYEWVSNGSIYLWSNGLKRWILNRIKCISGVLGLSVRVASANHIKRREKIRDLELDELNKKIGITDIAKYYGFGAHAGRPCKCWIHPDTRPSLSISWDNKLWFCHSCNIGGGIISLIRESEIAFGRECDSRRARKIAHKIAEGKK